MRGCAGHLIGFPQRVKYNNTGTQMQNSVYHMTLANFTLKRREFGFRNATFLWTSTHNVTMLFAYLIH